VVHINQGSVAENLFCGSFEIACFYKFIVNYYIAIKYLGNMLFDLRIFNIDWSEIWYPTPKNPIDIPQPIPLPKFFNCFNVKLPTQEVSFTNSILYICNWLNLLCLKHVCFLIQEFIMLVDAFSRFWGPTFMSD